MATTDLDGWWVATEGRLGGVPLPDEALAELALRVCAGRFVFGTDEGQLRINRHTQPQQFDLIPTRGPNRGRVVPGIVETAPGMLRLCFDLSGLQRPVDFRAAAGSRRFLATYRRAVGAPDGGGPGTGVHRRARTASVMTAWLER